MKDKKIVVYGANGNMGQAICWALKQLGYHTVGVDTSYPGGPHVDFPRVYDEFKINEHNDVAVVVSAMPYHQNLEVAIDAISQGVPYVDLGGHVKTSSDINKFAKLRGGIAATDQGLAPGWVNIVAEMLYGLPRGEPVKKVVMLCGGIPAKYDERKVYNYKRTWSADGLINEYKDDCVVLKGGEVLKAPGMSGYAKVTSSWPGEGQYECFRTSGGASHTIDSMLKKGVEDCEYKTVRWLGHHAAMSLLIKSDIPPKYVCDILDAERTEEDDKVVFHVDVDRNFVSKYVVANKRFSAMQMATAFPVSSVVNLMAQGRLSGPVVGYEEIGTTHFSEFNETVSKLMCEANEE